MRQDLHRGCTIGMDFGDLQVENGCFIEEDGSTYCFCDFNRCNAAGIIDLRNLEASRNNENKIMENEKVYDELLRKQTTTTTTTTETTTVTTTTTVVTTTTTMITSPPSTTITPTTTTTTTATSSSPNLTTKIINKSTGKKSEFPFNTKYDSNLRNLDDLLTDYLEFSKKVLKNQTTLPHKNDNSNVDLILKKIQEFSGGLPVGSSAYSIQLTTPKTKTTETEEAFNKNIKSLQDIKDRLNLLKTLRLKASKNSIPVVQNYKPGNASLLINNSRKSMTKSPKSSKKQTTTSTTTETSTTTTTTSLTTTTESTTTTSRSEASVKSATLLPRKSFEKSTKMSDHEYIVNPQTNYIDWVKTYQEKYNSGIFDKIIFQFF